MLKLEHNQCKLKSLILRVLTCIPYMGINHEDNPIQTITETGQGKNAPNQQDNRPINPTGQQKSITPGCSPHLGVTGQPEPRIPTWQRLALQGRVCTKRLTCMPGPFPNPAQQIDNDLPDGRHPSRQRAGCVQFQVCNTPGPYFNACNGLKL